MPVKVKAIEIHAFRGIPDLTLELNGKNLLVQGENGSGKSSIIDAVEFFFRETLSYFEGAGTQTLSLRRHLPHKNFRERDVKIEMTFDPGNVALSRSFVEAPSPPEQFEEYFQIAQRGTFILRRAQILKFIVCRPADRFQAIASILGIEHLDETELAIKRVRDQLEGSVISKRKRVEEIFLDLSSLLAEEISDSDRVVSSLNKHAREAHLPTIKSLHEIDTLSDKILEDLTPTKDLALITRLNDAQKELVEPLIDDVLSKEFKLLHERNLSFMQDETRLKELSRTELLRKGRQAIEADRTDICPLCGQKINREAILNQIDKRLETLGALSEQASEIRRSSVVVEERLNSVVDRLKSVYSKIQFFPKLEDMQDEILNQIRALKRLLEKVVSARELKESISLEEFHETTTELKSLFDSLSLKCETLLLKMGVPKDWKEKYKVVILFDRVRNKTNELQRIQKSLRVEEKRSNLARKLYSHFTEAKKAKIDEIYKTISEDLNRFYCSLHPGDPHKNVGLSVAPTKRASAALEIESFGRAKEDPRALTSEGHQDSLGLCIFLAFVKKFNKGCTLIMLDDVVTTIDAQHRELICELLLDEFRDYQLIITTHDEVWYQQLRSHQRTSKRDGDFLNFKITRWDAETGPTIEPYKPRWERIQEKIRSSDKHGAGNEGRQYLESLLKKICETTIAPVPFRTSSRYMVADLLLPAKKRIEESIADDDFRKEVLQRFRKLESEVIMGNILSHDNPLTDTVSIKEVQRFCKSVHELDEVFCCPECGTFLRYYQDMKKLRCPNSKCGNPAEIACK